MMDSHHWCQFCQENFSTESDVTEHMKSHIGSGLYACVSCPETFALKTDCDDHKRKHAKENSNYDIIKQKVSQEKVLAKSSKSHPVGEKPIEHDVCKKIFSMRETLNKNIRTHISEKSFECDVCKKRFSQKGYLEIHTRTHTGEKPFECNVCKKRFSRRYVLNNHIRTHTGEKPFECDICKKRFKTRGELSVHIRTHTGEKPYKCGVCHKGFSVKVNLDSHNIRNHSGERLQRHIENHGPFSCDVCHKTFEKKRDLKMHGKTHTVKKSLNPRMQEPFAIDFSGSSNEVVASNSEDKGKDIIGRIPVIPDIGIIKHEKEDVDLRFDSNMEISPLKQNLDHYLNELHMDVKIENIEFKEELF